MPRRYRKRATASPYRNRRSKRASRPRRSRYSRRYKTLSTKRSLWKNPLPRQGRFKFRYNDTAFSATLNAGSAYFGYNYFRGNGPYDPDSTGVGVQPYGWDIYMGANKPYETYYVTGSKIKIFAALNATTQIPKVNMMLVPTIDNLSYLGVDDLLQTPNAKGLVLSTQNGSRKCVLSHYMATRRVMPFGSKDASASAEYNASPSLAWYWYLAFDGSSSQIDAIVIWDVEITYYTRVLSNNNVQES